MDRIVLCIGRFSTFTRGHEKVFRRIKELEKEYGIGSEVVVMAGLKASEDKSKNPLTAEERVAFIQRHYDVNVRSTTGSAYGVLKDLEARNVHPDFWLIGDDRKDKVLKLLENFKFETKLEVLDRTDGYSATKARQFAINNDVDGFRSIIPEFVDIQEATDLMELIRSRQENDVRFEKIFDS